MVTSCLILTSFDIPSVTDNMLCAMDLPNGNVAADTINDVDQDTCQGDSGSPIVLSKSDSWEDDVQVGVVSWGIGCTSPVFPGVVSENTATAVIEVVHNLLTHLYLRRSLRSYTVLSD